MRVLLEGEDGYRLSELEDREVYDAIENVYVLETTQRRLFTAANLLPRALAGRLHKWIEGVSRGARGLAAKTTSRTGLHQGNTPDHQDILWLARRTSALKAGGELW